MEHNIEKKIENVLMSHFPGLKIKFTIDKDGSWEYEMLAGSKERFDEQYPNMSREEADDCFLVDVKEIIRKYVPPARFLGYERYGAYHSFDERAG